MLPDLDRPIFANCEDGQIRLMKLKLKGVITSFLFFKSHNMKFCYEDLNTKEIYNIDFVITWKYNHNPDLGTTTILT